MNPAFCFLEAWGTHTEKLSGISLSEEVHRASIWGSQWRTNSLALCTAGRSVHLSGLPSPPWEGWVPISTLPLTKMFLKLHSFLFHRTQNIMIQKDHPEKVQTP